jgi:predicted amidohydrolase YtcJ
MAARLSAIIVAVIVGATLVAGLIVGAQRDGEGPVDLIVHNGRVSTGDPVAPFAGALAVRGNQIIRVGSGREIRRLRRPQTTMLDAGGGAVIPSLSDARVSLVEGGLSLDEVDLSGLSTVADLRRALRAWALGNPAALWVRARGWSCGPADAAPTPRQTLDAVETNRPVYVDCSGGRGGWTNSAALEAAGFTAMRKGTRHPGLVRDERGEPTGMVSGPARALVRQAMSEPSRSDRLRAIGQATAYAHALGVTSVHDATPSTETIALYDDLRRLGELRVRIFATLPVTPGFSPADVERLDAVRARFEDDPLLKLGAVRLTVDESLDDGELGRLVSLLDAHHWQIIAEAANGAAVNRALEAFARAARANPAPAQGRRHRIEVLGEIEDADAERLSALGAVAVVRPAWPGRASDPNEGTVTPPWMTLWRARSRLVFASDWPAGSLDPREALAAAARGAAAAGTGPPADGESAVSAHTAGAAYAAFDDHRKGTLASGMLADFVVLSADVFAATPDELSDAAVTLTVFDGRVVYRRADAEGTDH